MLDTILTVAFTVLLVYLIIRLLMMAIKLSWSLFKGVLLVAFIPCVLGGLFILGVWYLSIPGLLVYLGLVLLGKLK